MKHIEKNNYIKDENYPLSEYNKIPLGHNRTNGAVYSKNNLRSALSALHFRYSIVTPTSFLALIRLNPNNLYHYGFYNTFDYNHFSNS